MTVWSKHWSAEERAFATEHCEMTAPELQAEFIERFGRVITSRAIRDFRVRNRLKLNRRGCKPRHPIGHESLSKNGCVTVLVNRAEKSQGRTRKYVLKHVLLWEALNGPVPTGMCLKAFGHRGNPDPSNWQLVPKAILPRLNGQHGRGYDAAPDELKPAIMAVTLLEHQARLASLRDS